MNQNIEKNIEKNNTNNIYIKTSIKDDIDIFKLQIEKINIYFDSNKDKIYTLDLRDLKLDEIKHILKQIYLNDSYKVGIDVKKELLVLDNILGSDSDSKMHYDFDIAIAAYILDSNMKSFSLEDIFVKYANINISKYLNKEDGKKNLQKSLFDSEKEEEEREDFSAYFIKQIYIYLEELIKIDEKQYMVFKDIEMPMTKILVDMQYEGIRVDRKALSDFGDLLQKEISRLESDIITLAGEDFNVNSPQQLGKILFEKLGLRVHKKTKTGYSTDVDTLNKLVDEHEIIQKILDYRQYTKLNSTYVQGIIPYINESTNRIHSYFHQTITATGRISSSNPNLQNIPTRTKIGKELRKAFLPSEGSILISADYSQIELRILADISKDKSMIESFNKGEDIHKSTASRIFNIPLEQVTDEDRKNAKAVNFGIIYRYI